MRQLTFILLTLGILSCNSKNFIATKENSSNNDKTEKENIWAKIDKKKVWFLEETKTYKTIDSIPIDFDDFYAKFISDSTFQKEHIESSILGAIGECDSTIILSDKNWEYLLLDFRSDFYNPLDSNTVSFNKSKILIENFRMEIGFLFQMGFEKKNGNWYLTLITIDNC
jgi:hypothetical protein